MLHLMYTHTHRPTHAHIQTLATLSPVPNAMTATDSDALPLCGLYIALCEVLVPDPLGKQELDDSFFGHLVRDLIHVFFAEAP